MNEDAVKGIIFDIILGAVAKRLVAAAPFLAFPGVNLIFMLVLSRVASVFYEELSLHLAFSAIEHKTDAERAAFEIAKTDLKHAQETGTGVEDAKARFRTTFAALVSLRP